MIYWKTEGKPCRNGLNVYRWSDPGNAGFVIKAGKHNFRVRWSKTVRQFFINIV